jgi:hypothetical protein
VQLLDRGLVPRLSIGTLQLSIRCSSIHFRPSRSLPVSDFGMLAAAFGVITSSRLSWADPWADADNAKPKMSNEVSDALHNGFMDDLANRASGVVPVEAPD